MLLSSLRIPALCLLVAACSDTAPPTEGDIPARVVLTAEVKSGPQSVMDTYSAVIVSARETRLASKVAGRIAARHHRPGDAVTAGTVLFSLDTRELTQAVHVANAGVTTAEAELEIAAADLRRWESLIARDAASRQSWEQAVRTHRSAEARLAMMKARLEVANSQREEALIRAPFEGTLGRLTAEVGQVVSIGDTLAEFHSDGARELDVDAPDHLAPPPNGLAFLAGQPPVNVRLVETAAALDPASRTRRLRYRLPPDISVTPGSIARLQLALLPLTNTVTGEALTVRVPVGAVEDRGQGPHVWTIADGKAQPTPVNVVVMEPESAVVMAPLPVGSQVIALGTHVLTPGLAVRARSR
jgi:RND family efflux transporter MFP subunit